MSSLCRLCLMSLDSYCRQPSGGRFTCKSKGHAENILTSLFSQDKINFYTMNGLNINHDFW